MFFKLLRVQAEGAPRNIAHLRFRQGGLSLAGQQHVAVWLTASQWSIPATQSSQESSIFQMTNGSNVNSASSSPDQLVAMGFSAPTWADVANGARPRRDDDSEDVPRSSKQGWQHEAASIVHDRLAESIWPGLTDNHRVLLRLQRGHIASSPFTTPPRRHPHARYVSSLAALLVAVHRIRESLGRGGFAVESAVARVCREAVFSCGILMWVCLSREMGDAWKWCQMAFHFFMALSWPWMPPWCLQTQKGVVVLRAARRPKELTCPELTVRFA